MKLPLFRFLPRSGATSGASGLCLSLCLGLWSASSSFAADSITQADADRIANAIISALVAQGYMLEGYGIVSYPISDEWGNLGSTYLQDAAGNTVGSDVYAALEWLRDIHSLLLSEDDKTAILENLSRIRFNSDFISDIQLWGESPATANGFLTFSHDNNLAAWSVRDDDANSSLNEANWKLDEILSALQSPSANWDGLEQIISGGILDASDAGKDSADISDQHEAAETALESVRAEADMGSGEAEQAEQDTSWALDDLIHDELSALPFLENIPDLNEIDPAPTKTISRPDETPYIEDWVLVDGGFRLVDEESPGSIPLPEIVLKRSATVTDSSRPFIQWAGRITSAIWGLAFGVWILHVARSDWAFYVSGGGSDATMLAEQMEARRCLDINAALSSDSSLL